ncbi:MAG TPA: hypothetical protein VER17_08260 [Tepidisphaeraceae bacterium]|nr:hypothetical protein [Tepidisphaeraceae bacterium]
MTPLQFLLLTVSVTAIAAGVQYVLRQRQLRALRRLAAEWGMNFSAADRFRLAARVAPKLPVPGAASVRVGDLLYATERERYRYIFATEYTVGVLRTKTGVCRVATLSEPRDAGSGERLTNGQGGGPDLVFAPPDLPLIEQYRYLRQQIDAWGEQREAGGAQPG